MIGTDHCYSAMAYRVFHRAITKYCQGSLGAKQVTRRVKRFHWEKALRWAWQGDVCAEVERITSVLNLIVLLRDLKLVTENTGS